MSEAGGTPEPAGHGGGRRGVRAWWHQQRPVTRKSLRTTLLLLVTGVLAAVTGVLTAGANSSLGPHVADYSVSARHEVMIDLGPLGAIIMDSPLPWPLGADVVVKEIPGELTAVPTDPVTGLADDLDAYARVFSQPQAAIADATHRLVADALGRTVLVWSTLLLLTAAGRFASGGLLRREAAAALRRHGVVPVVAVVVVGLVAVQVVATTRQPHLEGHELTALEGTPLEGLRMTGRMGGLVDTYGGMVLEAYEENEEFYTDVTTHLAAAYEADPAPLRPVALLGTDPEPSGVGRSEIGPNDPPAGDDGTRVAGDGTTSPDDGALTGESAAADEGDAAGEEPAPDEDSDGEAAETGGEATTREPGNGETDAEKTDTQDADTEEASTDDADPDDAVTALLVSDLHCNIGMAPVIATALQHSEADVLIDAGDMVMSGTSVESSCVNTFAGALPDGVPAVVATGNHDSVTTARQLREAGYIVLGGEAIDVAGLRLLGDTDPTLTSIGDGTRPERDETFGEMGERLADVACQAQDDDDPVDLLVVHNPLAAQATLESGCVPLALAGHKHRRIGPEVEGQAVRHISSTTGGAVSAQPTVGTLRGTAEMTVLRIDAATGAPLAYRTIQLGTETEVVLGRWYAFPHAEPEPDPMIGPGGQLLPTPGDEEPGDGDDDDRDDDRDDEQDDGARP